MKINAYIGVIGSGKDYLARKQCDIVIGFGDRVREELWVILGWKPQNDEQYSKFKNKVFIMPGGKKITGRQMLTGYGTDLHRKEDPDRWVRILCNRLRYIARTSKTNLTVGIIDCRFENEIKALLELEKEKYLGVNQFSVNFVHTDYKSSRYDAESYHESERISKKFAGQKFEETEFNNLIRDLFA